MAFCSKCGTSISDGAKFCPVCGSPVGNPQGAQPQFNQQPNQAQFRQQSSSPGNYRANIRRNDPVKALLLSIVTCGIYGLVWYFQIISDLNAAAQTPDDKTPGMVLLLTIVTCGIYGWIWLYQAGQKVDKIRQMNGESPSNSSTIYLLLSIFGLGIVVYYLIQTELNKVAAYTD